MEDIRIGRKSRGQEINVPLTTTIGPFISPAEDRIGLTVYPPVGDTVIISSIGNQTSGVGIRVNDSTGPLVMTLESHGGLVMKGFTGQTVVGSLTATYTETLFSDK